MTFTLNDRRSWRYPDPAPGVDIEKIQPISSRAGALVARSDSEIVRTDFVQVAGAVSIMSGLDYHYLNFLEAATSLSVPVRSADAVRHEAIAWLNRVGQLRFFLGAALVTSRLGDLCIPNIEAVMPFRHKHAAHRSIDHPRRGDDPSSMLFQAMALSDLDGIFWHPRFNDAPQAPVLPAGRTHYLCFQIPVGGESFLDLNIEVQHPEIMGEAYLVLERLLT